DVEKTMLTASFVACETYEEARDLTYIEFPSRFVYHPADKIWTPRQQGIAIGRVVYISPADGDVYFLRILVNVKFKQACYARGLLDDDREWHNAIEEPSQWATGRQLRRLFVTILIYCQVEDEQIKQYTLIELEQLLKANAQSLTDYPDIPLPDQTILSEISLQANIFVSKTVLRKELSYDVQKEAETHGLLLNAMNKEQRTVYDAVLHYVGNQVGQLFFVYGAGGTGKTYLYRTLIAKLRSVGKVVIPVYSSGIAALLLPGGKTAHSRFKLPLTLSDVSMCDIHRGSTTLDRSLRDLLAHEDPAAADKPFGGKTVLLGGDFRQILPVVLHGKRPDTVLASISKSYLWKEAKVFTLSINMCLRQKDKDFAKWILDEKHEEGEQIAVNKSFLIPKSDAPHEALAKAAYPDFLRNYRNKNYLRERAVLTPTNSTVHEVNSYLLSQVPSHAREYLTSNSVELEATPDDDWTNHYPQEYLNSLEFPGLPNHRLCLKEDGLCNGTRMVVTRLGDRIVKVEIMTGKEAGERVLIPRIQLTPIDTMYPFTFRRRQYLLRLCYAMTINKSQGQSLNQVALYLPRTVFTHGQLYVTLSRVTKPEGLKILDNTSDLDGADGVTNIVYKEIFKDLRATQVFTLLFLFYDMFNLSILMQTDEN
ncbi:hypothetical protein N665_0668s0005, partial [Sinapis alba]